MNDKILVIQKIGNDLMNLFHHIALLGIGATIVWSAVHEYLKVLATGHATLEDILLLFIYLELGAMAGIYFKTRRLPVQYIIYIAITALSRHLVIDVQMVTNDFHIYLLLSITIAIVLLSLSIMILSYTSKRFGNPEEDGGGLEKDVLDKG